MLESPRCHAAQVLPGLTTCLEQVTRKTKVPRLSFLFLIHRFDTINPEVSLIHPMRFTTSRSKADNA